LSSAHSDFQRAATFMGLDRLGQLLMACSSTSGASSWLDVVPTFPDNQLTDMEMRTAILIWLGAPIPWLAGTGVSDPLGRSVLCDSTAARIARHDGVNAVIADFLVDAGSIVWNEVTGVFGGHTPPQASTPRPPRGLVTAHAASTDAAARCRATSTRVVAVGPGAGVTAAAAPSLPPCAASCQGRAPGRRAA
jgi:hypothetical protein